MIYLDNVTAKKKSIAHANDLLLVECTESGNALMPPQTYLFNAFDTENVGGWRTVGMTNMKAKGWRVWLSARKRSNPMQWEHSGRLTCVPSIGMTHPEILGCFGMTHSLIRTPNPPG